MSMKGILVAHLGNCLLHQLSEGVAGVLAPDVLHQLGDALCIRLRLKLVTLGFQEHLDVLRTISLHSLLGLLNG